MRKQYSPVIFFILFATAGHSQGLLNKLKNKANQEVNKLEKGATPSPSQGTAPNKNKLSANVTRNILLKLHEDEEFDYSENCIDLNSSLDQMSFILLKKSQSSIQCYSYQNGARKPIACPAGHDKGCTETSIQCSYSKLKELDAHGEEIKKYVTDQSTTNKLEQPVIPEEAKKMAEAYMTPAEKAEFEKSQKEAAKQGPISYTTVTGRTINFNGKNYGTVQDIIKFYLSPDNMNFYAEVREDLKQSDYKIITSASPAVLKSAIPVLDIFASPDNSEFAIYAITMEQKYFITTSKGKTFPISDPTTFKAAWYSPTGNHLITYFQNALYLDGNFTTSFDDGTSYKPCDLFISSDGKGVTSIKNSAISFADGDYFQYPLKVTIIDAGGKSFYKWLALEGNELAVYQKPY